MRHKDVKMLVAIANNANSCHSLSIQSKNFFYILSSYA